MNGTGKSKSKLSARGSVSVALKQGICRGCPSKGCRKHWELREPEKSISLTQVYSNEKRIKKEPRLKNQLIKNKK